MRRRIALRRPWTVLGGGSVRRALRVFERNTHSSSIPRVLAVVVRCVVRLDGGMPTDRLHAPVQPEG